MRETIRLIMKLVLMVLLSRTTSTAQPASTENAKFASEAYAMGYIKALIDEVTLGR
ncbi:MAG: hypothetical protein CM1200mP3_10540 [Chloroflexota bacterium]|nr:MAG: hypothetical protein CM1200mP3_10540 [Chloroflexota bacterium]